MITSVKRYVPAVNLSINDNIDFLENISEALKEQFPGTNINQKYQPPKKNIKLDYLRNINPPKNIKLDYLIDPTFRSIIECLFLDSEMMILFFFDEHYIPLVKIKDVNALIDNKQIFDQPGKNKQEAYEKIQ